MPNENEGVQPNYFWTDYEQAVQRLYGTVVTYEGRPVYICQVDNHDDGIPRGFIMELGAKFRSSQPARKMLNSPGFGRFRTLPKLGWVNLLNQETHGPPLALFLKRRPVNGTHHGLCSRNVMVVTAEGKNSGHEFLSVIGDDGFLASQNDDYPPVDFLLANLQKGAAAGVSLDYAIQCDASLGLKYLLRKDEKVGLFVNDEIKLPENFMFLRDEIQATRALTGRVVGQL